MIDWTTKFNRRVLRRLKKDYIIWLTTVGSDLSPQPRPVWFIWDGESILLFSQPQAHKVRHIARHPRVALTLNTDEQADEVMVILGSAAIDPNVPPAHQVPAYFKKYRMGIDRLNMTPAEFSADYSIAIRVIPTAVRGF
jgi:PPOX class probable F420-dependent enzyme